MARSLLGRAFRSEFSPPRAQYEILTHCLTWRAGSARHRSGTGKAVVSGGFRREQLDSDDEAAGRGDRLVSGASCPMLNLVPGVCADILGGALARVPV